MNCNYNMDSGKQGKLVIFNQVKFSVDYAEERKGTEIDEKSLKNTFKQLGFEVIIYENLKKKEVKKKITEIANQDYSEFNCFVCAILTHGGENGELWASDDKYNLKTVVNPFRSCTSLIGKPKLFFIQACRGDKGDPDIQKDDNPPPTNFTIRVEADFLISYACTKGYACFRETANGSWYIQALTEFLKDHGYLELTHILTLVNRKVCMKKNFKNMYQAFCFVSGLTGFLYFSGKKNYPISEVTEPTARKKLKELETEYAEKMLEIAKRRNKEDKEMGEIKERICQMKVDLTRAAEEA